MDSTLDLIYHGSVIPVNKRQSGKTKELVSSFTDSEPHSGLIWVSRTKDRLDSVMQYIPDELHKYCEFARQYNDHFLQHLSEKIYAMAKEAETASWYVHVYLDDIEAGEFATLMCLIQQLAGDDLKVVDNGVMLHAVIVTDAIASPVEKLLVLDQEQMLGSYSATTAKLYMSYLYRNASSETLAIEFGTELRKLSKLHLYTANDVPVFGIFVKESIEKGLMIVDLIYASIEMPVDVSRVNAAINKILADYRSTPFDVVRAKEGMPLTADIMRSIVEYGEFTNEGWIYNLKSQAE